MRKEEKITVVAQLKERFAKAKAVIFAENKGLKVGQVTELRKALGKERAAMKVVKNRLLKRALQEAKIEGLGSFIEGILTVTTAEADPVTAAKILANFAKENELLAIKGGLVDGRAVGLEQIRALASLPSKEELYGLLLRCLQGPAAGLVNVLSAVPRNLVTVLERIKEGKKPNS
ncbi:MAG: 50S ribosomal protein L10 [Deltaproteobacteria bacterium]|nr:50S ribosomal protein L10 [Deltaproteobacteria bacterium]MBI4224231.1 50S ribosomal protein L10 [Deltaproteobacteria bacterium]